MRNAFDADIVVLITDGGYQDLYGNPVFGIAGAGPNDLTAYAIVETGAATTGRFTFAHEVAHIFGGFHEKGAFNDPDPDGFAHAHRFVKCGKRKWTILHQIAEGKERIPYYSNPDVEFLGHKTGKEGERDNALQIRNAACTVANFRESTPPFSVYITGEEYACPCSTAFVQATATGGEPGPYSFSWFVTDDGINWTALGSGDYKVIEAPCEAGELVHVRVDSFHLS